MSRWYDIGTVGVGIVVALLVLVSFWSTVPATYQPDHRGRAPSSLDDVRATADDIDRRAIGNESVFTVRANYYAGAETDHPYTSRVWMLVSPNDHGFGQDEGISNTSFADEVRRNLTTQFESGQVSVVIMTPRTAYLIQYWESLHRAFKANFCHAGRYEEYDVNIFEYSANARGECENTITAEW